MIETHERHTVNTPGKPYKELNQTSRPIARVLADRWSPRSLDPDYVIEEHLVTAMLEAARWAPSGSNTQPGRFIVGARGTATFDLLASVLSEGNRLWAPRASILVLAVRVDHAPDGTPYKTADYDTGQAVAHMVIQAHSLGLVARQMGGFDAARAADLFGLEASHVPRTITAIGAPGRLDALDSRTAEKEAEPRIRLPLDTIVLRRE